MKKVLAIVGARPQFIKHYPFELEAVKKFDLVTVHTGQHYDKNMSQVFFDQLGMRRPNFMLDLGGGNHGEQTGKMLIALERIVVSENPDAIVVYGDTNSTLAGALVASKLHIKLVHIEAGLRSFNKEMPEEVNRILTDHISDLLLVPSHEAVNNLKKEGIKKGVHIVGDIMKDMIRISKEKGILKRTYPQNPYYYVTLHRPYNVDKIARLRYVLNSLGDLAERVVFAIHPRTRKRIDEFKLSLSSNIELIEPQPYFENLNYLFNAKALITDSGGMQKEAYWMEKPCTTIRKETEWLETLKEGANKLIFNDLSCLENLCQIYYDPKLFGNGFTSKRIVEKISTLKNDV